MAIETFHRTEFESTLPKDKSGTALWEAVGIVDGEYCYRVRLKANYDLWVRSSVRADGQSAGVAKDSIRAWIVRKDGGPKDVVGNKAVRWVDRRSGWKDRMLAMLRTLARLVLAVRPCPDCLHDLTPFTVKKAGPNKGRGFVKCCNEKCPGQHPLQWVYDLAQAPPSTSTPAPATPPCPKCNAGMVRMSSGKGWRCGTAGNFWRAGRWSVCDGTLWDASGTPKSDKGEPSPAPDAKVAEKSANAIVRRGELSATFRLTVAVRRLIAALPIGHPEADAVTKELRDASLIA